MVHMNIAMLSSLEIHANNKKYSLAIKLIKLCMALASINNIILTSKAKLKAVYVYPIYCFAVRHTSIDFSVWTF